ncbi:MAG: hypothetical protein AAF829_01945 [Pseudomonadota bacterium]
MTRGQHLTQHGLALDRVWVISDLRPGKRIVEASAGTNDGPPWTGTAIQPFLEGSLWALGYGGVSWRDPPHLGLEQWGTTSAFETVTDRGLTYRGAMRARLIDERLDLVIWIAEAEVYAPRIEVHASAMLKRLR